MAKVKYIPEGTHTLTTSLVVRGGKKAIEFYKAAFGAKELSAMYMPDGKSVMHAELQIGDSKFFLGDENKEMGAVSPQTLGGSSTTLHIYTEDCDATIKRAVAAGAKVSMPAADMFWGDRYGKIEDPFGHHWSVGTHVRDVTPEEMQKAMQDMAKEMAKK